MAELVSKQLRLKVAQVIAACLKQDIPALDKARPALLADLATLEGNLRSLEAAVVQFAEEFGSTKLMQEAINYGQYLREMHLERLCLTVGTVGKLKFDFTKVTFPALFDLRDDRLPSDRERGQVYFVDSAELLAKYDAMMSFFGRCCQIMSRNSVLVIVVHTSKADLSAVADKTKNTWKSKQLVRVKAASALTKSPELVMTIDDSVFRGARADKDFLVRMVHFFDVTDEDCQAYNRTFLLYQMYKIFDDWGQNFPSIVKK